MMGREYGGEERREDTVDFPVAIEPVRPIISMFAVSGGLDVLSESEGVVAGNMKGK